MRTQWFLRLCVSLGLVAGMLLTPAHADDLVERGAKLFAGATFRGNGRTCQTCHTKDTGALSIQQVSLLPSHDVLFQHDAADVMGGNTFNRVRENATFLVPIDLPQNVSISGSASRVAVFPRGVPTVYNSSALDPVLMYDGRAPNLQLQALDAWLGHSQITRMPTDDDLNAVAAWEQSKITVPALRRFIETGVAPELPKGRTAAEKRGRLFFTDDNPVNGNPIKGRCVHCHSGPMLNATSPGANAIFGIPVGTRFFSAFVSEFQLGGGTPQTFEFRAEDGTVTSVTSTDPGRALITGNPADANAFKIPTVWNARQTAPYFHNNGAKNLDELLNHYQQYFNFVESVVGIPGFGMSDQDKADIRAYLELL